MLTRTRVYNRGLTKQDLLEKDKVVIFGEVELSEDERSLLNLGPGFMLHSPLNDEEMQVEAVVALTKIRWGRRSRGTDMMSDMALDKEEMDRGVETLIEEESLMDAISAESRDVLGDDGHSFRMGRKRATDMKNNREVCMPGPAPPSVEAGHNVRMSVWQESFTSYRKSNCNKKGEQTASNITLGQQLVMKSLIKRVNKAEIMILEADKGKRFVVVDEATYIAMSLDHTSKDVEVALPEVKVAQRILSQTAKLLGGGQGSLCQELHQVHGQRWVPGRGPPHNEDTAKGPQGPHVQW